MKTIHIWTFRNSKLAKDQIVSFNLPAGLTCPGAGICAKICYAKKHKFLFPSVKQAYARNLAMVESGLAAGNLADNLAADLQQIIARDITQFVFILAGIFTAKNTPMLGKTQYGF